MCKGFKATARKQTFMVGEEALMDHLKRASDKISFASRKITMLLWP